MRFIPITLVLLFSMCASGNATLKGTAYESKAGLVVEGTIIVNFPESEYSQYLGKTVEVTGLIENDHPWKCKKNKKNEYSQCFDGPAMTKVFSIKLIQ